eukprot:4679037-Amphidinium_carterae.1
MEKQQKLAVNMQLRTGNPCYADEMNSFASAALLRSALLHPGCTHFRMHLLSPRSNCPSHSANNEMWRPQERRSVAAPNWGPCRAVVSTSHPPASRELRSTSSNHAKAVVAPKGSLPHCGIHFP